MTEIRTIRADEAEPFLELVCRVFRLDITRARTIFFSEPLFDLSRKWALFVDGFMVSVMTTSPLEFGWGRATGVSGVATDPAFQRRGHAGRLLEAVLERAEAAGEGPAILFAHEERLYRHVGFETLDVVVRGQLRCCQPATPGVRMRDSEVHAEYGRWAAGSPGRFRRGPEALARWSWSPRHVERLPGGYACIEPGQVREAWFPGRPDAWPLGEGVEWYGFDSVATADWVPVRKKARELFVMCRGFPHPPQMFMTDQF